MLLLLTRVGCGSFTTRPQLQEIVYNKFPAIPTQIAIFLVNFLNKSFTYVYTLSVPIPTHVLGSYFEANLDTHDFSGVNYIPSSYCINYLFDTSNWIASPARDATACKQLLAGL